MGNMVVGWHINAWHQLINVDKNSNENNIILGRRVIIMERNIQTMIALTVINTLESDIC